MLLFSQLEQVNEILSNVVDQARAYPVELGGFFNNPIAKFHAFDDFFQPLIAV